MKKLIALLLSACMLAILIPATAFAGGNPSVIMRTDSIGDHYYDADHMMDAFFEVGENNEVITLLDDIEIPYFNSVYIGYDITIELNGHNLIQNDTSNTGLESGAMFDIGFDTSLFIKGKGSVTFNTSLYFATYLARLGVDSSISISKESTVPDVSMTTVSGYEVVKGGGTSGYTRYYSKAMTSESDGVVCMAVDNNGGYTFYHKDFREAFDHGPDFTVTLLADVRLRDGKSIYVDYSDSSLDLNGHYIYVEPVETEYGDEQSGDNLPVFTLWYSASLYIYGNGDIVQPASDRPEFFLHGYDSTGAILGIEKNDYRNPGLYDFDCDGTGYVEHAPYSGFNEWFYKQCDESHAECKAVDSSSNVTYFSKLETAIDTYGSERVYLLKDAEAGNMNISSDNITLDLNGYDLTVPEDCEFAFYVPSYGTFQLTGSGTYEYPEETTFVQLAPFSTFAVSAGIAAQLISDSDIQADYGFEVAITDQFTHMVYEAVPVSGSTFTDVTVRPIQLELATESTAQLQITTEPDPCDDTLKFSSSDPKIASVDENGLVTAHKYGKTVIHVKAGPKDKEFASVRVQTRFYDVLGSGIKSSPDYLYYYDPVYWAADNRITKGYDEVYFGPQRDCARRELMIFLWRMAGCPEFDNDGNPIQDARNLFNDMGEYGLSSDTNKAVAWGYLCEIVKGFSDGGFHPTEPVNRKDTMIMLYRFAGKPAYTDTKGMKFKDVVGKYKPATDTYNAICWAYNKGIANGYTSGEYKGQYGTMLNCLREHIVTFLYRYDKIK